ncbi:TetR/AcrR family transcriptional regulator [Massilia orientalis]|uniref:CerR family C-terminal domain-containing protein n=1 Tax=Massilia orientalis TaxID=3050128 RepID=A0ACC7MJN2_9BURK|nr:CerR family C-terminal domain-containing protein [Massilia sp. YIM B02787]
MTQASPTRKVRANGQHAREKILLAALGLFSKKGFTGTSVRDVASAADVNLAAISYHFGDKAGLYRAALHEYLDDAGDDIPAFDTPGLTLEELLRRYMRVCLRPLGMGKPALLSVQLRVREFIEPTGLMESLAEGRDQAYALLLGILTGHFGLEAPDDELEALAFSIFAFVGNLYSAQDHLAARRPALLDAPDAAEAWEERFTAYACAMVAVESERRKAAAHANQGPA